MQFRKIFVFLFIPMLLSGCISEYFHAPDEIHAGVLVSETNFGHLGRAPTIGMRIGGVWYRTERFSETNKLPGPVSSR